MGSDKPSCSQRANLLWGSEFATITMSYFTKFNVVLECFLAKNRDSKPNVGISFVTAQQKLFLLALCRQVDYHLLTFGIILKGRLISTSKIPKTTEDFSAFAIPNTNY